VNKETTKATYPKDTVMGMIVETHPRFAQLVVKAKYDWKFSDPQGKFTVFVPDYWEKFTALQIENSYNIGQAKQIVGSNTIIGRIRRIDLMTSQNSQLNSFDNMGLIHAWWDIRDNSLKIGEDQIVTTEMTGSNGIIHFTTTAQKMN